MISRISVSSSLKVWECVVDLTAIVEMGLVKVVVDVKVVVVVMVVVVAVVVEVGGKMVDMVVVAGAVLVVVKFKSVLIRSVNALMID